MQTSFINRAGISTPSPGITGYYHFVPAKGYRIVVLDNYEISMLGQAETSDTYRSVCLPFVSGISSFYLCMYFLFAEFFISLVLLCSYYVFRIFMIDEPKWSILNND